MQRLRLKESNICRRRRPSPPLVAAAAPPVEALDRYPARVVIYQHPSIRHSSYNEAEVNRVTATNGNRHPLDRHPGHVERPARLE